MTKESPDTIRGVFHMFPDEKACLNYLIDLRWATGYLCPACTQASTPWHESRNRLAPPFQLINMFKVEARATPSPGAPSAAAIRESAQLIFDNLEKVERKILLVGKDGKIWKKTLSPFTPKEINDIRDAVNNALKK